MTQTPPARIPAGSRPRPCFGHFATDTGQAIVETALVVPMLLVLMIGALEASRLLYATVGLTTGAMAGAQYAALYPGNATDTPGIESAVRAELTFAGTTATNPAVTSSASTDAAGETYVTVSGTFTWTALMPYPGLPRTVTMTRTAVLQVHR